MYSTKHQLLIKDLYYRAQHQSQTFYLYQFLIVVLNRIKYNNFDNRIIQFKLNNSYPTTLRYRQYIIGQYGFTITDQISILCASVTYNLRKDHVHPPPPAFRFWISNISIYNNVYSINSIINNNRKYEIFRKKKLLFINDRFFPYVFLVTINTCCDFWSKCD